MIVERLVLFGDDMFSGAKLIYIVIAIAILSLLLTSKSKLSQKNSVRFGFFGEFLTLYIYIYLYYAYINRYNYKYNIYIGIHTELYKGVSGNCVQNQQLMKLHDSTSSPRFPKLKGTNCGHFPDRERYPP